MNRTKLFRRLIFIIVIIWVIFALVPEIFNYSPLPTGGWNWLGFVGTLIALGGVVLTIENGNKNIKKQNQLSVIPCLDVPIIEIIDCSYDKIYIFRLFEEYKKSLINHQYEVKKLENPHEKVKSIKVRNLGLSTAFSVDTFLYKLDSVKGLDSLDNIREKSIENFYTKVKTSNYKYIEGEKTLNDEWQIFTTFNLSNDDRSEINFVFKFIHIESEFHNIIEFRFKDIYENEYYQLLYLYFDEIEIKLLPISKIYKGKSHK